MNKTWHLLPAPKDDEAVSLAQQLRISTSLARLLIQRGIDNYESAEAFFRLSLNQLHDPFLMKDMFEAVERLTSAIENNENILVYGDYDVDGTTSVTMMYHYLKLKTPKVHFYIPDRYKEGYGVSGAGIQWASENEIDLIISLDCGIKANSTVLKAKEAGIDFIICDHHRPGTTLPEAIAVLDPKREDCQYPYKELSGCGVGFKLIQGVAKHNSWEESEIWSYLDLVAVSISADIVPITGENRTLCHFGIKQLQSAARPGLQALINIADIKNPITVTRIVFGIAPRINAAGRINHAHDAVELLLSSDEQEARILAMQVNEKNNIRRETELEIVEDAMKLIDEAGERYSTVLYKEDWHKGVIGIVASKCIEHYYRPTIILTESNGKATGSARSVRGYDVHEAIEACSELLEQFGGHKYAAGLTLKIENVPAFKERFEEIVRNSMTEEMLVPSLTIDQEISLDVINKNYLSIINQMEPFGPGNMTPIFSSSGLQAVDVKLLKDLHLKMTVVDGNGIPVPAIGFNMPDFYENIKNGAVFDMAYTIEENNFRGNSTIQLHIKDIKFAEKIVK
jgi:single-stranded-DNA-specific exonuclease